MNKADPWLRGAADWGAFIRDLHALHPMPRRRIVIYATRDPGDALELANRIAVLWLGRILQCGTAGFAGGGAPCPPVAPEAAREAGGSKGGAQPPLARAQCSTLRRQSHDC